MSSNCGGHLVYYPFELTEELRSYGVVYKCACECHYEGYHDIFYQLTGYYREEDEVGNECRQANYAHCVEECFCCNELGWLDINQDSIDVLDDKFVRR